MEKFRLCFEVENRSGRYLIPELLGENQPDGVRVLLDSPGVGFRYQYPVLPEGLLPRFIVHTHSYSQTRPAWRWRTGVVLQREGCSAVVRADARERRVDIHITGQETQRRSLLAIIRDRFDEQHRDFKGLAVDERVPLPNDKLLTVSYRDLLKREMRGELYFYPENVDYQVSVSELLNGVDDPKRRAQRLEKESTMAKKHVFLSYCHDDAAEASDLRNDLIAAGENVWWDQDILPGQDWKLEIYRAMNQAYATVLCLSAQSAIRATSGIYPEALKAIELLREYSPGSVFLIPVRFSDCLIPPIEIDSTRRLNGIQYVDLFIPGKRVDQLKKLTKSLKLAPGHP